MSELEAVLGLAAPATVTIAGESVEIRPLTLRQLGPFARAMAPLDGVDLGDLLAVARHVEEIVEAVSIATGSGDCRPPIWSRWRAWWSRSTPVFSARRWCRR